VSKVRTDKVTAVDDVSTRLEESASAVVTEYRGLTVAEISSLRRALRASGTEYKVHKNTLARRAFSGTPAETLVNLLEGPTAIAWVKGDISAAAKVLKEFAKATPSLVLKGGVLDGRLLTAADLAALADLPSRDVLLSQLAGLIAAPLRQMAGLLKAVPQNFAYGLSALLEAQGGAPVAAPTEPEVVGPEVVEPEAATEVAVTDEVADAAETTPDEPAAESADQ
jgi:large subunit ribosomal protein L10